MTGDYDSLTQDAIPADEYLIENLLKPFEDEEVCAAYGRQMADKKIIQLRHIQEFLIIQRKVGLRVKRFAGTWN